MKTGSCQLKTLSRFESAAFSQPGCSPPANSALRLYTASAMLSAPSSLASPRRNALRLRSPPVGGSSFSAAPRLTSSGVRVETASAIRTAWAWRVRNDSMKSSPLSGRQPQRRKSLEVESLLGRSLNPCLAPYLGNGHHVMPVPTKRRELIELSPHESSAILCIFWFGARGHQTSRQSCSPQLQAG